MPVIDPDLQASASTTDRPASAGSGRDPAVPSPPIPSVPRGLARTAVASQAGDACSNHCIKRLSPVSGGAVSAPRGRSMHDNRDYRAPACRTTPSRQFIARARLAQANRDRVAARTLVPSRGIAKPKIVTFHQAKLHGPLPEGRPSRRRRRRLADSRPKPSAAGTLRGHARALCQQAMGKARIAAVIRALAGAPAWRRRCAAPGGARRTG